jgi:hypothetical protein
MITLSTFGNGAKVPANLQANANVTIAVLSAIFAAFPNKFRFTSGYRTPEHNKAVGGVPDSYHIQALAGDFVPLDGSFDRYIAGVTSIAAKYGYEVIKHNVGSGWHFHIEPMPKKVKRNK